MSRVFPGGAGVHSIDLRVASRTVHALVGLNGAGKTTLLRLLLGMLRPDSGTVALNGRELSRLRPADWMQVGHLVGAPLAYPELGVRMNLELAARLAGVRRSEIPDVVDAALDELELGPYADKRVGVLSQGNLQRVGLAVALQHSPQVIVLDEPSSALDPSGVVLLRELLLRRVAAGAAVLVSSHHLDEVARIADVITVVNGGEVVGELEPGSPDIERAFFARVLAHDESRAR
ncbi:MAG TPA: ABC transporter ATP-binding protein [Sporichthyaceae bacterium]